MGRRRGGADDGSVVSRQLGASTFAFAWREGVLDALRRLQALGLLEGDGRRPDLLGQPRLGVHLPHHVRHVGQCGVVRVDHDVHAVTEDVQFAVGDQRGHLLGAKRPIEEHRAVNRAGEHFAAADRAVAKAEDDLRRTLAEGERGLGLVRGAVEAAVAISSDRAVLVID